MRVLLTHAVYYCNHGESIARATRIIAFCHNNTTEHWRRPVRCNWHVMIIAPCTLTETLLRQIRTCGTGSAGLVPGYSGISFEKLATRAHKASTDNEVIQPNSKLQLHSRTTPTNSRDSNCTDNEYHTKSRFGYSMDHAGSPGHLTVNAIGDDGRGQCDQIETLDRIGLQSERELETLVATLGKYIPIPHAIRASRAHTKRFLHKHTHIWKQTYTHTD